VTVGIVTKNRPEALRTCLFSLALLGDSLADVIIVDDTCDVPVDVWLRQHALLSKVAVKVRVFRHANHEGYIVGRNSIMRAATTPFVLLMDDDAWLLEAGSVMRAFSLMAEQPTVGAVAFAMATADGSPWEPRMQPAPVEYACRVPSFIGFAHVLRRDVFLRLGGYREAFQFYGEEKEYCLRLMNAGFEVVYLPEARAVHVPHPSSRSQSRYVRLTIRNDCLGALVNEPLPLPLLTVPVRLSRYLSMRRNAGMHDPGGLLWIVGELMKSFPAIVRSRRPVTWATLREWRRLRREWPAIDTPAAA